MNRSKLYTTKMILHKGWYQ